VLKDPEHERSLGHTLINDPRFLGGARAPVQVAEQPVATEHLVAMQVHIERLQHVERVRQGHAEALAEGLQRFGQQEVDRKGQPHAEVESHIPHYRVRPVVAAPQGFLGRWMQPR